MRTVTVTNHLSLDGVMQAPAREDEDIRGGFERGGWATTHNDEIMRRVMSHGVSRATALLLGRRTYEDFAVVWPGRSETPFSAVLDNTQKYVASRTLSEPLTWQNSTLLAGEAVDSVAALKQTPGPDLTILGSGELIQSLRHNDLIDSYVLMIHPVVLGSGRRLFREGATPLDLQLVDSVTTTTGVVIATYRPS